tara:strand:- start:560 stop:799 length:240 start_codon:yes stop_codon:yes gene_type:complete
MRASIILALIAAFAFGLIYFLTTYRSAFEADQKCHAILSKEYLNKTTFGCDHDLETRQWLLFEAGENSDPSIVIRRFRY